MLAPGGKQWETGRSSNVGRQGGKDERMGKRVFVKSEREEKIEVMFVRKGEKKLIAK